LARAQSRMRVAAPTTSSGDISMYRITTALLFSLQLLAPGAALAGEPGDSAQKCDGSSTVQIIECLKAHTAEADKRLNKVFETAIKASTPQQVEKLREAERLWISFRDADCLFFSLGEGTVSGVAAAQCLLNLTEARTRELEGIGHQ
jgi:uncharacterized protein YecT (DUF1311 family)